jgi:hypothetical protein
MSHDRGCPCGKEDTYEQADCRLEGCIRSRRVLVGAGSTSWSPVPTGSPPNTTKISYTNIKMGKTVKKQYVVYRPVSDASSLTPLTIVTGQDGLVEYIRQVPEKAVDTLRIYELGREVSLVTTVEIIPTEVDSLFEYKTFPSSAKVVAGPGWAFDDDK